MMQSIISLLIIFNKRTPSQHLIKIMESFFYITIKRDENDTLHSSF